MTGTLCIVGLIIISIFIILVLNTRSIESTLLSGFWSADADFCQKADIDLLLIYVGSSYWSSSKRPGYILMKNSEGLILNNPVEFSLYGGISINPQVCSSREYSVHIDWLDEEPPEFFPTELELYYYPNYGKLVFVSDDQIHAIVYKDHALSSTAASSLLVPENTIEEDNVSDDI